jgi:hypothetical protein
MDRSHTGVRDFRKETCRATSRLQRTKKRNYCGADGQASRLAGGTRHRLEFCHAMAAGGQRGHRTDRRPGAKGYRRLSPDRGAKVEEAQRSNPKATQEEVARAAAVNPHSEPDRAWGPAWRRRPSLRFHSRASASSGRAGVSRGGCCLMTFPPLGATRVGSCTKGLIVAGCGRRNRLCQTNLSWIELLQPSAARSTPGQCRRCR